MEFARFEWEKGVKSTYFVLVTGDFYNIFSRHNRKVIRDIIDLGHEIGLHFDQTVYGELALDTHTIREKILCEAEQLKTVTEKNVNIVSMHRPSRQILEGDLQIPGMTNSYGRLFFKEFKYISDSRRNWREPVESILTSGEYRRLQILTHSFWYYDEEKDLHDTVKSFICGANRERYDNYKNNFTDLESVLGLNEICG